MEGDVPESSDDDSRIIGAGEQRDRRGGFPIDALTHRERQVFQMLGQGLTIEAVADRLGVTCKTAETHRRRAKEKLGYDTVDEVISHAAQWMLGAGNGPD